MKFHIEHSITLYYADVFEADNLEDARRIKEEFISN